MKIVIVLILTVLLTGCTELGMNMRAATTDAGCGLTVVGALEAVPEAKFEVTKAKIIEISTELMGFVNTGSLAQLPLDVVKEKLEALMIKNLWGQYTYLVDTLVQYVKTQSVSLTPIGTNNIKLIEIGLTEIIRNAERSTIEGRAKNGK